MLPSGWVEATVESLAAAEPNAITDGPFGSNLKSADYVDEGVRVIRLGNIGVGEFVDDDTAFITHQKYEALRKHEVFAGDLLIAALAEPVGRVCEVPASLGRAIVKADCVRFKVHERLDRRYVAYAMNSPEGRKRAEATSHGNGRLRINLGEIRGLSLPIPPLPEQRRIVARLDALLARSRKARESLERLPALLETLRQSVLAAAFRGDLTKEWREAHPDVEPADKLLERIRVERRRLWEEGLRAKGKDPAKATYEEPAPVEVEGLPELPAGWAWATLPGLCWDAGYGTSEKCDYEVAGTPVLRIPNIARGTVDLADLKFSNGPLPLGSDEVLAPGDFLTVRTNGSRELIGRSAVVESNFDRPTFFASYLIRHRLLGDARLWSWVALIWQSPVIRRQLELLAASSAGQYNVSLDKLRQVAVPIPPERELERATRSTAAALDAVDAWAGGLMRQSARLAALDQSLLARAFRGELVPQDPNDEPASVLLERIRAERAAEGEKPKRGRKATGEAKAAKRGRG